MATSNATMPALIKAEAKPGIWLQQTDIPTTGPDEVLIKVHRTAICGTDVHIYNWDEWAQRTIPVPMVVGHEFGGEIAKIGSNVRRPLKVGQRVSGEGHIVGEKSRAVRAGHFHLDPDTQGVGVNRPGAFASYLTIPAFNVIALPDHVDMDVAAMLDPLGNAVHTALAFDLIGEDVLITGAGPIGIMAAAVARHVGARHVVITDINHYRLELAANMVDCIPVNVAEEALPDVRARLGMSEGFDVAMEMSGAPQALDTIIDSMVMGGKVAMLGFPAGKSEIEWSRIVFKALTIKTIYGREMFETWYKMLAMLGSGLDVSKMITHRYDYTEFQKGFDAMRSGKSGKVILDWSTS
ncbi:L-threonine 3-dehydrogenase [Altererythrobacter ishigakiensis]|nr:L-threonine 3-dehydrogenase [Altererythrobacter ishigakiensis]